MNLEKIVEKVKKGEVTLLSEFVISETEYRQLINYAKKKIDSLQIQTNATYDILLSVTLVQIAMREYKVGNYWDCFSEILPDVPSNKKNYIGQVFYATLKLYKLFTIESEQTSRMQYVENIKAHAFVPNNYLTYYYDFLFSFYERNLLRTIPEDLNEDIEEFQEYLKSTLNDTGDSIKIDSFGNNTSKSYMLLKATRIVLSRLDSIYIAKLLKSHLELIDNYYFDNQLPIKQGRFEIGISEWSKHFNMQLVDKAKRKRKNGKWYFNRRPYLKLLDKDFKLIVPEQKFRLEEYNGIATLMVNDSLQRKIDAYRAFGIIITEETTIEVNNVFSQTKICINSLASKEYIIPDKSYRIFDEDKNEITKLKPGYCYLAVKQGMKINFQECKYQYVQSISVNADIYFVEIKEASVIYIDNTPLSLIGEFSEKTHYEYVSNEYSVFNENNTNIQTTYKHPVVSFVLDKDFIKKTLIWCNEERFNIDIPFTTVFFELPYDNSKIGVNIDLNNILLEKDGIYKIYLDEPAKGKRIIEEYLLLNNLRCSTDKRRYSFDKEARIYISEGYSVIPINSTKGEKGEYNLKINESVKNADFNLTIDDRTFKLVVPINILKYGFNGLFSCDRYDYMWYKNISNYFSLVLPGAVRAWVYLNKEETNLIEGELTKNVFNFDIASLVEKIASSKWTWNYFNVKYFDNRERRMTLFRILKTLYISQFDLFQENNKVFIFTEYFGEATCFVKIIDSYSNNVIIERRNLVSGIKTDFSELKPNGLYRIEQYSAQEDDFGFGEEVCHLKTIYKIGAIDFSNISNCKAVIDKLLFEDQTLELKHKYTIRELVKLESNIYIGKITGKPKNASTIVREDTIFQCVRIEIVEFVKDKIHFTLLINDNLDWLEPLYNCNSNSMSLEDDNKAKYLYLDEEKTEVVATLRRDK